MWAGRLAGIATGGAKRGIWPTGAQNLASSGLFVAANALRNENNKAVRPLRRQTRRPRKVKPADRPMQNPSAQPIVNAPTVVIWTIAVIWIVFVILLVAPQNFAFQFEFAAGVSPARLLAGPRANGGVLGMLAPLFSHMLIHAGFMHVAFNSLWLLAFGAPVANRLRLGAPRSGGGKSTTGAMLFVSFFALCGAAGALLFIAFNPRESTLLVGASGGVSGLLGALARFAFRRRTHFTPPSTDLMPLNHPIVLIVSAVIIVLNVSVVFVGGGLVPTDADIAWEAHLGGYLFGLVTFPAFDWVARRASLS